MKIDNSSIGSRQFVNPLQIFAEPATALATIAESQWAWAFALNLLLGACAGLLVASGANVPQRAIANLVVANALSPILFCVATFVVLAVLAAICTARVPQFRLVWALAVHINLVLSLASFVSGVIAFFVHPDLAQRGTLMLIPSLAQLAPKGRIAAFLYQLNPFQLWWYALLLLALVRRFRAPLVRAAAFVVAAALGLSLLGALT